MTIHQIADGVTLHVGNCLDVLPSLALDPSTTVAITDPPWPEAKPELLATWGVDDCRALWAATFSAVAPMVRRLVVVLGCQTDPRHIEVPASMPFVRVCWLRLALPSYRGTILNGADVAYVFGSRESTEGKTVIPGEVTAHVPRAREGSGAELHPTPRREEHMRWLVSHLTRPGDTVLDPFAGSGTTLLAARDAGRRAIGIERHEPYLGAIRARFDQGSLVQLPRESVS